MSPRRCSEKRCQVRFFQWDTLGVLTAVEFDEVQKNQRTKIKRSTCRLAFRTSKKPYKTLEGKTQLWRKNGVTMNDGYPLVNVYIKLWKSTVFIGQINELSMAMASMANCKRLPEGRNGNHSHRRPHFRGFSAEMGTANAQKDRRVKFH